MVMIRDIARVIAIIAPAPTPMHTIKTGPSAVLGSAFNGTRYGSSTFEAVGHHQRMTAMMIPQIVFYCYRMIIHVYRVLSIFL